MQKANKTIGLIIQIFGVGLIIYGIINGSPAAGGFGVLIGLIGRVIAEYGDDWFD